MKMLYFMNIDWNWIKQRPHFLAEEMSKKYDTTVVYIKRLNRKGLQKRETKNTKLVAIRIIPLISRLKTLGKFNDFIIGTRIELLIRKKKPDIIFITYPLQLRYIPKWFSGQIIYDCMDNHIDFLKNKIERDELQAQESKLVEVADAIFVSSENLLYKLKERYTSIKPEPIIVRNAFDGKIITEEQTCEKKDNIFRIAYIGTLSEWFDWKKIEELMNAKIDVELHLFGPLAGTSIPELQNIVYHGTKEHDELYDAIADMDALIMPFIVNDIIKAVDPVKLYEYINFNKNIIVCEYDEIKRFNRFVYFYNSSKELIDIVEKLTKNNTLKYDNYERIEFLEDNNWKSRAVTIDKEIMRIMSLDSLLDRNIPKL